MHAFDLATTRRRADPRADGAAGRNAQDARRPDARRSSPDMLVIADAERAVAVAGVMGGAESEVTATHDDDRARERVLQPALGAAHEQGARAEDGSEHAVRARRRSAACRPPRWSGRARCSRRSAPGSARGTVVDRYPVRVEPTLLRLRRERIAGLLGADVPDADVRRILESLGFALRRTSRAGVGRHRADAARRRRARSRSHRGSRAPLRIRSPAGDVSRADVRAAARSIRGSRARGSCARC